MMKGVILAAGMGTRLKTQIPKCLTLIKDDKTILDFQLERLSQIGVENIIIIVGFKKESIQKKFPNCIYLYNKKYQTTNTAKSLLIALQKIDDDVIWMNGDIYFDEGVLELISNNKTSTCLVDNQKCGKEEVKYNLAVNGYINQLSKSIKIPMGEALGINLIKKQDLPQFVAELEKVSDSDYFEKALENLTINEKIKLLSTNVGNLFCKEIDFPNDLEEVRNYILLD